MYDVNDLLARKENYERDWRTVPRVGRDAQIDGGIAYWTASAMAIIYPISFSSHTISVRELITQLEIMCSPSCSCGICDALGDEWLE